MALQILGSVYEFPAIVEKYIKDLESKVVELEAKVKATVETTVSDVKTDVVVVTNEEKEIAADVQRVLNEAAVDKDKFVAWVKKGIVNLEADGGKVEHFFEHLFEKK